MAQEQPPMPAMDYHYEALDGKTGDLEAAYSVFVRGNGFRVNFMVDRQPVDDCACVFCAQDEIVVSETPETGLTSGEAKLRLAKYGYNQVLSKHTSSLPSGGCPD
eukprot:1324445-Amorphochlora_amoeboformis.AAC.1